jgi:hypothetical protein
MLIASEFGALFNWHEAWRAGDKFLTQVDEIHTIANEESKVPSSFAIVWRNYQ